MCFNDDEPVPAPRFAPSPERWAEVQSQLAAAKEQLKSRPTYGTSPCGHDERFVEWEDHSKPIRCTVCEIERLQDLNAKLYSSQTAANQECEVAEDHVGEANEKIARLTQRLAAAEALWTVAVEEEGSDWADEIVQAAQEARRECNDV